MKKRMKNIKNRYVCAKTERIRLLFKALASNEFLPKDIRSKSFFKLQTLNGKPSKIRNRCIVTSRGRGIVGVFKLARSHFHINSVLVLSQEFVIKLVICLIHSFGQAFLE